MSRSLGSEDITSMGSSLMSGLSIVGVLVSVGLGKIGMLVNDELIRGVFGWLGRCFRWLTQAADGNYLRDRRVQRLIFVVSKGVKTVLRECNKQSSLMNVVRGP